MTIRDIYNLAIKMGIEADPRGEKSVKNYLKRKKEEYDSLGKEKKEEFDLEKLTNPYADSRILYGDPDKKVKRILMGIDMDTGEVLLADRLSQKGVIIDLVLGHHPHGPGLAALDEVMEMQAEMLATFGVPINIAEGILKDRISEVRRRISPKNHYQSVDSAKLLNIPFICLHTPFDNLGYSFLNNLFQESENLGRKPEDEAILINARSAHKAEEKPWASAHGSLFTRKKPETVGEVINILKSIPEFKMAVKMKNGPSIFSGEEKGHCGKVIVGEFTGGTEGAKEMYEKLAQAGVGTIIGMHVSEEHRKEAIKNHVNLVVAGHIVSDSLGANLFLDELEKKGMEVITCSGMIRYKRINK